MGEGAVDTVLILQEGNSQQLVYFTNHLLKEAELHYIVLEKLAFALTLTARRLQPYFLFHPITVLTNITLGRVLTNPEVLGRLIKWMTELNEYDIQYQSRTTIKVQALADFLAETSGKELAEAWDVFVDGSTIKQGSGVGIVLTSPRKETIHLAIQLSFVTSNNEAESEALLASLRVAKQVDTSKVILHSDSQLAVQQLGGVLWW